MFTHKARPYDQINKRILSSEWYCRVYAWSFAGEEVLNERDMFDKIGCHFW